MSARDIKAELRLEVKPLWTRVMVSPLLWPRRYMALRRRMPRIEAAFYAWLQSSTVVTLDGKRIGW